MKLSTVLLWALVVAGAFTQVGARELKELKVLYVGTERAGAYVDFLKDKVGKVESLSRVAFKPADAEPFDVVLLDWPQGPDTREMRKLSAPLGTRDAWSKPTVLLGKRWVEFGRCMENERGHRLHVHDTISLRPARP